ncbi:uncharacterized protein LOC127129625 [Lathyrus oleraceus]|uniref:uncharacterized protein LOC127129625 n=1 Tax=Pisum sativum TaxID=3888 RepID=UPI0021D1A4BF|nr:uncharacterized protein LOC127129625 [Pisum sativum]
MLDQEEAFWAEKAKLEWYHSSDRNISYFHCDNIKTYVIDDVIPNLVTTNMNNILTSLPSDEEIRCVVFGLNKNNAPEPDDFGGIFFHTLWDINKHDVCADVLQFFKHGKIISNFNVSNIVLIPKSQEAIYMDLFRPIALSKFKFKIITKITASRLSSITEFLVSKEQRGFINFRSICECVCMASEAFNVLDKKLKFGNIPLKVDIAKAFDTIR